MLRPLHTITVETLDYQPEIQNDIFNTSPLKLPVGTVVQDRITEMEYVVGEGMVSNAQVDSAIDSVLDNMSQTVQNRGIIPKGASDSQKTLEESAYVTQPLLSEEGVFEAELNRDNDHGPTSFPWRWIVLIMSLFFILLLVVVRIDFYPRKANQK